MKRTIALGLVTLVLMTVSLSAFAEDAQPAFTQEQLDALTASLMEDNSEMVIGDEFRVKIAEDDL